VTFERALLSALADIAEIKRRMEGMIARGTVHSVDAAAGTVRLRVGGTDSEPFLTAPIPYAQSMGALKLHSPPSVGQQMTAFNDGGDYAQGLAIPMTQSDANKSPSDKGNEHVLSFGSAKVELRGNEIVLTIPKVKFVCGGSTFELSESGLELIADEIKTQGSAFTHNAKNIGSTHLHGGVIPGGGNTDVPV